MILAFAGVGRNIKNAAELTRAYETGLSLCMGQPRPVRFDFRGSFWSSRFYGWGECTEGGILIESVDNLINL
ncbi:hypothetical protein SAMN05192532_102115 [Alteribacillus iranensis]|uniref:Uncharacterized protein n=1 Tax=Alteribacillus iranensis TaxID=930128 RepID=A0A1I2B6G2_9BACI|nr:hypothetical protein SAMN05192532_102115 [Alteribacillus iranensis]